MKAVANDPICPLLESPSRKATLLDEALYGMVVTILDEPAHGWFKVRTHYHYEGIVPAQSLLIDDDAVETWSSLPKMVVRNKNFCDVLTDSKFRSSVLMNLPRGAVVSPVGTPEKGWQEVLLADGQCGYVRASILSPLYHSPCSNQEEDLRRALVDSALLYQGTHYRWGGKSPMGIDCSGLVSMAYLLCGILIYRDAQIKEGFPLHEIDRSAMKPGDLLFFPGHVAMYMGNSRYCHSTGRAGDDGFTFNSLNPDAPDFRADLAEKITQIGSYF